MPSKRSQTWPPGGTLARVNSLRNHHGTAYGLLQAVSDYVDHERMQDATAEKRFLYQTAGAGASLKARTELVLISEFCPGLLDGPTRVPVAA